MSKSKTATREQWLKKAILALTPLFKEKGYVVPKCHVSCGFASTDVKRGHIGQCWSTKASADKVNQIFISPGLSDSVEVLDTLMHELGWCMRWMTAKKSTGQSSRRWRLSLA